MQQSKHASITECTATQNEPKKLKPGLVASYDLQPGNREVLRFRRFINLSLTYLDTYPLTYSPETHTRFRRFINLSLTYLDTYPLTYSPETHTRHLCVCPSIYNIRGWCQFSLTHHHLEAQP